MKNFCLALLLSCFCLIGFAQDDTTQIPPLVTNVDTTLRIIDLNPFFTLHVDSTFSYQLHINKQPENYFWYLKNAPIGLRINKENGTISFKADKSYFLSGRLKYDVNYNVNIGVQNLKDPKERIDTNFTIVFYNTEIVPSKVKPTVSNTVTIEEGETVSFKVICDNGNFPIENIITLTDVPIAKYQLVQGCGDEFSWTAPYDFAKETDQGKQKIVNVSFIGSTKFQIKDTATVKIIVKDALNYPLALEDYKQSVRNVNSYVLQLKYTFLQLDRKLKKTKSFRTSFDITSAGTSLTGTVLSTSDDPTTQKKGKILPSVGLALVPIKEAAVPNKSVDQNQAAQIRTSIKRLEYMVQENQLIGEKDPDISKKTNKLRDELKQVQVQLIEVPIDITNNMSEEELNRYFNSPKVNKKYRLSRRK
ncbi:MAG TPA: hypothetical protein VNT20_08800 [Flavisolibacter sp.]|nr:hypothetical protein [Flavisolibacter sp.]